MKISKRIISFVLTVATVIGVLASMPAIQISASQSMTVEATEEQKNTNYMTKVYSTPQEKLASMTLAYSNDDDTYRLYVNPYTGEVATEDVRTGQILFTNPYIIGCLKRFNLFRGIHYRICPIWANVILCYLAIFIILSPSYLFCRNMIE